MDDSLTKNAVGIIKYAPIFLLFNGFWMIDNQQIFGNVWFYIMRETDQMKSGHSIRDALIVNYSTPLQLLAFGAVFLIIIQILVPYEDLARLGFSMAQSEIEVDEDLPNFFSAIKISHADEIVQEAKNMRENYGFEIENP